MFQCWNKKSNYKVNENYATCKDNQSEITKGYAHRDAHRRGAGDTSKRMANHLCAQEGLRAEKGRVPFQGMQQ